MISIGKKYIDAEGSILGRIASYAAKYALEGYEVYIFNAEKAVVVGKWNNLISHWNHKINERGDWIKGPFYPKRPDRILRRVIRGMLPKNHRGREALKRVKVYLGVPEEFKNVQLEKIEDTLVEKRIMKGTIREYYTLGEISKHVGGKF
ncbi:MAG: 50S ribosomal protein L13 [Nanopusillaceae archaeon]